MPVAEMKAIESRLTNLQKAYKAEPQRSSLKECLKQINGCEGEELEEFTKTSPLLLDTLISLMDCHKVPVQVIEIIQILIASDVLPERYILAILNRLATPAWNIQTRMKLLQISFYFTRYDIYTGKEAFNLLFFILGCFETGDSSLDSAARPIATLLIEKVLKRAVVTEKSYCDLVVDTMKSLSVDSGDISLIDRADEEDSVLSHSRSQECLKTPSVSYAEDILKFLDAVYFSIHNGRVYTLGTIFLSFIKYPGVFTIAGVEEFVSKKFFGASVDILKHGKTEDKEFIYLSLIKIQNSYNRTFEKNLEELYAKLPKLCDDRTDSFYFFIVELLRIFTRRTTERDVDPSRPIEVPSPLYELCERVVNEVQLSKSSDKFKMRFIEEVLRIFRNSSQIYGGLVDVILNKIQNTKEIVLDIHGFMGDTLRTSARNGDRELFERVLCMCPENILLEASIELKSYMKESWSIAIGRTTASQRRNLLVPSLNLFSAEELGHMIKFLDQEELSVVFNRTTEILTKAENLELFEELIKRIDNVDVVAQLLVRFYGFIQEQRKVHPCESVEVAPDTHPSFDPDKLSLNMASQPIQDQPVPVTPLNALKRFVGEDPQHYPKVLSCLSDIIRIVNSGELWDDIFSIIDLHRDRTTDQVSIMLVITQNYIGMLQEKYLTKILNILKRMSQTEDCNTCLNALFMYQEVGEFLITKSILGRNIEGLPGVYGVEEEACGKRDEKYIKIWRDFVILGAFIMKDTRNVVVITVIKYLICFVKAEQAFFNDSDFKFVEKIVFSQMLKLTEPETAQYAVQELSDYARSHPLHEFTKSFTAHLVNLLFTGNDALIRAAIDGLRVVFKRMYDERNYVICGGNDLEGIQECESQARPFGTAGKPTSLDSEEKPTNFVIRQKDACLGSEEAFKTFVEILTRDEAGSTAYLKEILRIFSVFSYRKEEIERIVGLLEGRLRQNSEIVEDVIETVDSICYSSGLEVLSLIYFSTWLNIKEISGIKINEAGKRASSLLLLRIGEIMRKSSVKLRCCEVLKKLLEYSTEETVEEVLDCVIKGCSSVSEVGVIEDIIAFSRTIFMDMALFPQSRRTERRYIEYLTFYHSLVQTYFTVEEDLIKDGKSIQRAYELVAYLTTAAYKDLRLKCYQILFMDFSKSRAVLQSRLTALFHDYAIDCSRSGDSLHNFRLLEVLYCLRCLAGLADISMIDSLKDEMADLLLVSDSSMLVALRNCFKILFNKKIFITD